MIGVYIYSQQGIKNPLELEDSSWKVFKVYEGNLDKNRWVDLVVVLQNETLPKENEFTGVPRRLVILKGKFFNRYKLLSQSDSALLCRECGGLFGDPFDSVAIYDIDSNLPITFESVKKPGKYDVGIAASSRTDSKGNTIYSGTTVSVEPRE